MGNDLKKIPKEDIQFLTENTMFQRSEIKAFYKDFMKASTDGYMDYEEFKHFLYCFLQESSEVAHHYFRAADKDHSGRINFKEFLLFLNSEGSNDPRDRLSWLFDIFDINGNGTVDKKEMIEIYKTAFKMADDPKGGYTTAEKLTDDMFECCDKDKDNILTKEEFINTFLENPQLFKEFPIIYESVVPQ